MAVAIKEKQDTNLRDVYLMQIYLAGPIISSKKYLDKSMYDKWRNVLLSYYVCFISPTKREGEHLLEMMKEYKQDENKV